MPDALVNGVRLTYQIDKPPKETPDGGKKVVCICGTGQPAYSWQLDFVPRFLDEGYQVLTFDNRGMPPSDSPPPPYSIFEIAEDAACLMNHLDFAPAFVVGYSLGAMTTQELALIHPQLVEKAVMMGTVGRQTTMLRAFASSNIELARMGITLPPSFQAANTIMNLMSPVHQQDEDFVQPWVELFSLGPPWVGPGVEGQYCADLAYDNRLDALRQVKVPSLVIGFEHDIVTPPKLCEEVAQAIPFAKYVQIPTCGHLGAFEDPKATLEAITQFLAGS